MKKEAYLLFAVALLTVAGCAQKTESEKAVVQIKESGKEAKIDSMKAVDNPVREGNKTTDKVKRSLEGVVLSMEDANARAARIKKSMGPVRFAEPAKETTPQVKKDAEAVQS